jgi:hypothetical protein
MTDTEQPRSPQGDEPQRREYELRLTEKSLENSNTAEALLGAAAAVVALLALAGVLPNVLAAVGTVVLGVAMLFEGAATAARYQRLAEVVPVREQEQAQVGGGLTVEVVGGAAGAALGLLALAGVEPQVLLPIASMVFGAAYVMSGGMHPALETWVERGEAVGPAHSIERRRDLITHRAVSAGAAARALAGVASAMLGILALAEVGPARTLSLVALLALGLAAALSASAFRARMSTLSHPQRF